MTTPTSARIGIVGAGPGGLTCARILQRHGFHVDVYDRDTSRDARDQGGSLDLRTDDGQLALREAGLIDEFFALCRPEGQEGRAYLADGTLVSSFVPDAGDTFKPEIDRGQLRDLLLDSLTPGTVHWGRRLTAVEGSGTLRFEDGSSVDHDLVIGADGAFSKVRTAVSPVRPAYSGVTFLEARFHEVDTRRPDLAALVGQGTTHISDGERAIFAQRNANDQITVYVMQRLAADWITAAGLELDDTDALRSHLAATFAGWAPKVRELAIGLDGRYIDRPLYVLPMPFGWTPSPSITLLGDAAHLMPPVGVGVNLAMLDACDLALALVTSTTVAEAVTAYEAGMLDRATGLGDQMLGVFDDLLAAPTVAA
ncbi:FAD-dependent oxidoreductase [Kribbella sp. NPDC055071]